LKNLKYLYLMNNKITHMPAEFLDLGLEIKGDYDGKDGIILADNPLESPPAKLHWSNNYWVRSSTKTNPKPTALISIT